MTTIAYNHKDKEIAVDSRTTAGAFIVSDKSKKWHKVGDATFIISGPVSEEKQLIDSWNGVEGLVSSCAALVIEGGKVYKCAFDPEDGFWKMEITCNQCLGSGGDYAIAAMDFGKSAKEAVKYAMTRDACSGGTVKVFKVG